jgi:hypothetical protein
VKSTTPQKIVCSALIGLLQFGGNVYLAEAASREDPRRHHQETRAPQHPSIHFQQERLRQERHWQEKFAHQDRDLQHWRLQNDQIHQQSLFRRLNEPERDWRHRQWLEEQRLQRQREEIRRRQWWEHQRHEQEMRRRDHELEWEWRHRQWLEQQRYDHELRQIEILVLALLLAT